MNEWEVCKGEAADQLSSVNKMLRVVVTTLTNAVSGQSQTCSGNLEISPGIGTLGNFSGKHAIIPGHRRKESQKFGRMIQISGTT